MLTLEGQIRGITSTTYKEKTDEFTGVVTPASTQFKVQVEYTEAQPGGDTKIVISDFNLKSSGDIKPHVEKYRALTGRTVRVQVALWKVDGKSGLAIPSDVLPTVLTPRPAA